MISIREQEYGLDVALYNEFTLGDFKLLEQALLKRAEEHGKPDVLLNLLGMQDFTLDMALEEVRFMRAHENDFGRFAIVAEDGWIKLAAHLSGLLTHIPAQYFESEEEAQAWLLNPVAA